MSAEFEQSEKQLQELIGSKVWLTIPAGRYKGDYVSRLEEVEGKSILGLAHPTIRGIFLPLIRNEEPLLKIEAPNCFYQAKVSVERNNPGGPLPLLWVKLVAPLQKVQRRMFVRVPCSLQANAFFLGIDAEISESTRLPEREWFPVRVVDMSLGGCGISVKKNMFSRYLEGGRYLLSLSVGGTNFFLASKLIKIFKKNDVSVEAGLAYESVTAFLEKLIVSFIRQQELFTRG